ncbi:MAG: mechanosensitive ion channel [Cyanobacteriota bacterium]|nr:mechanosensitive ion channel [Cyanobacteriota bacterium]
MLDFLLVPIEVNPLVAIGGAIGAILFVLSGSFVLPKLLNLLIDRLFSERLQDAYDKIVEPYQFWLAWLLLFVIVDLVLLFLPAQSGFKSLETFLGLAIALGVSLLGFKIFRQFFDIYLLNAALQSSQKINSEFLIFAKLIANGAIILIVVIIFAQTHRINILGLIASLGVGGIAVAFAAQKTLEQVLGGIVIYLDRPFTLDDYIHLPDGTFGRVESIGWRSTKIRTSGKGSLIIIPNSVLTQVSIENLTGAKKVISLLYLTFYRAVPDEEKALIRQVILESTKDIFGIDYRSTEVSFKDIVGNHDREMAQAQINFFLLGSEEVSMELRRQLLDIAKQNINKQLKDYGIAFEIEERTINVDSPITI